MKTWMPGSKATSINMTENTMQKLVKISLFTFLVAVVTTMLIPASSYADDKLEKMKWQLVFLSPYGGCTNYQYQMTNTYDEIASKYFTLYQFNNTEYPPQCMSDKKYTYYQTPSDLNLIILVYDNEIGKKELQANGVGGLYNHIGTDITKNHTIIMCDCSNFGFSDPVWILSHELSHFITNYLGFDQSVVETKIHSLDSKYDQCIEGQRDNACSSVTTHLYGDYYFGKATVMAPYPPAIGMKMFSFENQTTSDATSSDATNSQVVMNMQKEMTKWWLAGKISDTEYTQTLGYMVGDSGGLKNNNLMTNVILEDGPDGKEQPKPIFYDPGSAQNLTESVMLKRIPFKESNSTGTSQSIPEWFKSRAYWWSQDQFTSDQDFVDAAKYLVSVNAGK